MNDLFSTSSFKKLNDQVQMEDIETGKIGSSEGNDNVTMDKFFKEVESVKEDLQSLQKLYRHLKETNEETKTTHNVKTVKELRSKMDSDVGNVLRKAKQVKAKLEALDRSNTVNRKLPGCGPGSSTDRTRTSLVSGLGKKLKDLMDDFQGLRTRMAAEYKETVERRYYTVTGKKADEQTIDNLISSGESETFLQKAIQEQGRGQIIDTISEIQERHDAVREIEKSLLDLHQVFLDMATLVESQGHQLNDIESHVGHASSFVKRGTVELESAREFQKSNRKWTCIAIIAGAVLITVLLAPIILNFTR